MTNKLFPIIESVEKITSAELNALKQTGFCFIKLDSEIVSSLEKIIKTGVTFFHQPENEKQNFPLNANFEGYLNHKIKGNLDIERYAYRGGDLPHVFLKNKSEMDQARSYFVNQIALPLIQKIFHHENIESFYENAVKNYSASLSLIYYPYNPESKINRNLKAHKDFVLLTVLYITKPGLEVCVDDKWYAIDPKPGYVVVNVANSLELMTGHAYKSSVHRAQPPLAEDRMSIATFLGPNPNIPICNYKTGEQLYPDFETLMKEMVKIVYPGTFDE